MKSFTIVGCSIAVSMMLWILGDVAIEHFSPNHKMQAELEDVALGQPYKEIRKGMLNVGGAKFVKAEGNIEVFSVNNSCFSTFKVKDGLVKSISLTGKCVGI